MTPSLRNPRIWLLAALALLPLMLTNDSLWLDEGDTAIYALQPDLHSWWHYLAHDPMADCQMPLSMWFSWVGGQWLGTGEWQMRAINLAWGVLALLGMYRVGKQLQMPWLPLLLAIQPYLWFYQNEARPYALQIACGAWLLAAFVEFVHCRGAGESWAWLLVTATFFLFLSTLLAPVSIAAVVVVGVVIAVLNRWKPSRKATVILLAGAVLNLPTVVYYVCTLLRGAKSAMLWHVDLKFFGYVLYELTGMSGLGLPAEEIRVLARSPHLLAALSTHALGFALPALGFALVLAVIILGWKKRPASISRETAGGLAAILGLSAMVFILGGLILQKAFWARHFASLFPFYVTLLGLGVAGVAASRYRVIRILPFFLVGLLLVSALNLRLAPDRRKENYRAAAQYARSALAENKSVWWVAASLCARYYQVPCAAEAPEAGKVYCPESGFWAAAKLPLPDVIILSKPDVFDPQSVVQKIIQQNHYQEAARLKSFTIWTHTPALSEPILK